MQRSRTSSAQETLAASIKEHPPLVRLTGPALPDTTDTARLVEELREISFPGFHRLEGAQPAQAGTPDAALAFAADRLPRFTKHAMALVECCLNSQAPERAGQAAQITEAFVERIPQVRELLAADVEAAFHGDPAARSREEVVLCYPGIYALTVHRYAHELWNQEVPILPRMMSELVHGATGIDIHPGAVIGRGVFIDHGTGVVIGETCRIGDGCRIYQGVTLGAQRFERNPDGSLRKGVKRHPTLEDNVTVYAGATILGGDTVIGAGSIVAGGVFVTRSVPPNHLVAGPKLEVRILPGTAGM